MSEQQPIRVIVEKRGGCVSGCGTFLAVALLVGIAVKYWYLALGLLALLAVATLVLRSQRRAKRRTRAGPRDPWLNEVVVVLADLGLLERARNTGGMLGGVPMEGDIGLEGGKVQRLYQPLRK